MNEPILKSLAISTIGVVMFGALWLADSVQDNRKGPQDLASNHSPSKRAQPAMSGARFAVLPAAIAASAPQQVRSPTAIR